MPLKVLVVTPYYKPADVYGGPVRSVATLCEGLAAAGVEVSVITTDANGPRAALSADQPRHAVLDGVAVTYCRRRFALLAPRFFFSFELTREVFRRVSRYDVVYFMATWTYPMIPAGIAAIWSGIPYVVSPRGSFMDWAFAHKGFKKRLYLNLLEKRLINRAAAIHCSTEMEAEQTRKIGFTPATAVIPNPIEVERFASSPGQGWLRRELGLSATAPLSIFVGRLHQEKNIRTMVEAFALVAERVGDAHLALIGPDYGELNAAREIAISKGIGNRVHFLGHRTGAELCSAYGGADLLLLLSLRESFGMVVVEALASGVPVLVSTHVGLSRDVVAAEAGVAVQPAAELIAEAWSDLLLNRERRFEMARRGAAYTRSFYSVERVSEATLALLKAVVSRRPITNGSAPTMT